MMNAIKDKLSVIIRIVNKKINSIKGWFVFIVQSITLMLLISPREGYLPWRAVFKLSFLNLKHSFSRSAVTIGAIASGTAAIVFLVGFAYGLQEIVTQRLVTPNALRLADVQSGSTALILDTPALERIAQVEGVEAVESAMSLAGSLKLNDSKTEVIVLGVRNQYLDFSSVRVVAGGMFSQTAEAVYENIESAIDNLNQLIRMNHEEQEKIGEVAGVTTQFEPKQGDEVTGEQVTIRIADDVYVPLRDWPSTTANIVGYVRGSVIEKYQAKEVWGSEYDSAGTFGRAYMLSSGEWQGKWLQILKPVVIYEQTIPTVFTPKTNEAGQSVTLTGYLAQDRVAILSQIDSRNEQILDVLAGQAGEVLGESTASAEVATSSADSSVSNSEDDLAVVLDASTASQGAQETSALKSIIETERLISEASSSAQMARVSLPRKEGKEILVSTGLLKIWEMKPEDAVGMTAEVEFIIGGGLVPGVSGRVVTDQVEYTIVGVFDNDKQSLVYAPLSDFESMGIGKYTIAKVLAQTEEQLPRVRELIEAQGFFTRSLADTLIQVERLFRVMRFLLGSFGMIAFIVALFGMFNTLTVSLLERTREIGVMKTFGTTNIDVVRLLLVESSMIGIAGGFAGVFLGMAIGYLINIITMLIRQDTQLSLFSFPFVFLILVFLLATVVGLLTGFYPARRAKNISALNALRYE